MIIELMCSNQNGQNNTFNRMTMSLAMLILNRFLMLKNQDRQRLENARKADNGGTTSGSEKILRSVQHW